MTAAAARPVVHDRLGCPGPRSECIACRSIGRAVRGLMSYRAQVRVSFFDTRELERTDPVGAADVRGGMCDLRAAIALASGWPPDMIHPARGNLTVPDAAGAHSRTPVPSPIHLWEPPVRPPDSHPRPADPVESGHIETLPLWEVTR